MDIIKVTGIAFAAMVAAVVLKQHKKEMALAVTITAGAIILFWILKSLTPVINIMKNIMNGVSSGRGFLEILTKSLGICFLTQVSADVCRDSGETAIASKVEMAGKTALLVLSAPLLAGILDLAGKLIWL